MEVIDNRDNKRIIMSLAFAFCENYSNLENGVKYVCNCLSEVGLLVTRSKESSHLILVTCSEDMLEREAGRIALRIALF